MARLPRIFAPGLLYHVIARGNQRRLTFADDQDYQIYLERLAAYRRCHDVSLYAYCLMPNHVHLLARTWDAPLAKFMQSLQQSYTQRFNRKHRTVGHLFQGRYRAIVCATDEYLATLVRYIHLNPVRAGLVGDPAAYAYSGHRTYLAGASTALIDPGPVLSALGGRHAYRAFVLAAIADGHENRYYQVDERQVLGNAGGAQRDRQAADGLGRRNAAMESKRIRASDLDAALADVAGRLRLDPGALRGPDRSHIVAGARALASLVLVRRWGYRVRDVAGALGRDPATISVIVSRLALRLHADTQLAAEVARLSEAVQKSRPDPVVQK